MFKDILSHVQTIYDKVKLAEGSIKQMAIAKPKVTGYLPPAVYNVPPDVYDQLMAFKAKRGLQSVEMAVTVILSEYFALLQAPVVTETDTAASRLETVEAKCIGLSETVAELKAAIATLSSGSNQPLGESESPTQEPPPPLLDVHTTTQSAIDSPVDQQIQAAPVIFKPDNLPGQSEPASPTALFAVDSETTDNEVATAEPTMTQAALAKRLGVSTSTISRMQSKSNFSEWSQQKDPEGIAWVKSTDTKLFYPQTHIGNT